MKKYLTSADNDTADPLRATHDDLKRRDAVFIDRDQCLLDCLKMFYGKTRNIDTYQDLGNFLNALPRYTKSTKMIFSYLFSQFGMNGIELAVLLHDGWF